MWGNKSIMYIFRHFRFHMLYLHDVVDHQLMKSRVSSAPGSQRCALTPCRASRVPSWIMKLPGRSWKATGQRTLRVVHGVRCWVRIRPMIISRRSTIAGTEIPRATADGTIRSSKSSPWMGGKSGENVTCWHPDGLVSSDGGRVLLDVWQIFLCQNRFCYTFPFYVQDTCQLG